jgi:hypothetical protein
MALSAESQRWLESLKTEGGLTDEAFNAIKSAINDKADNFVKGSVLRQDDYSRQMAAFKETQTAVEKAAADLKVKEAAVTKFQTDLGTWKEGAEANYKKALAEREASERRVAAVTGRFRTTAESMGLDANELLKDLDVTPVEDKNKPNQNQQQFDATGYVKKEDLGRAVAESGIIDASIHDLDIEHQALTGQRLPGARALVEEAIKANKPLTQYVAEKYNYADLRKKADDAAIAKRIEEGVQAELTKRYSENMLPGNVRPGVRDDLKGSPIFQVEGGLKPPGNEGGGGVSAAMAAFSAGKYKGGHQN